MRNGIIFCVCLTLAIPLSAQAENMIERGKPLFAVTQVTSQATTTESLKARAQQATQDGAMTKLGLLKSGNLMN